MGVNPGMIEEGLTENDFVAFVISDLLRNCNEGTADVPLLEEGEDWTVNNNIVRLLGHANHKITAWQAL